jgi:3-phosphoshikimate 1-carboxyvinyltransferase
MTTEDALTIDPSTQHADPVVIETYDDHRMAMAFAILGLARGGVSIADPRCVEKSYPGFWRDLAKLY